MTTAEDTNGHSRDDGLVQLMLKTRTVLVNGEIDQKLAGKVISQLVLLDTESHDTIRVIITSQGGHIDSGFAIHDMLRFVESDIVTIGAGWVASIAVPIMFSAPRESRLSLPNTRFLIHQPSGGAGGHASDIRIEAQEILKIRERINRIMSEETGQPIEKIASDSDRNFWMNAEEAVAYGLISRIITSTNEVAAA